MKQFETIAALLSKRVGFDAKIIGDRKIARAVKHRRVACNLPDIDAYLKTLQSSSQEFNELVEQIVVPETWFFRDRKPFDFLVNFARSEWLLKPGTPKLRVLSVPCSTGEEPYSIAIALLEAGLPVNRFSIDAIDISERALVKAKRAIYGKNSFRGEDWVNRDRYFQPIEDKYTVCPIVRNAVHFRQGNVLNELVSTQSHYDIIFCRNLLIYLEDSACQQVLNTLHNLISTQGLLFVGASETGKVMGDRFSYLRQSFTFVYRKIDPVSLPSLSVNLEKTSVRNTIQSSIPSAPSSRRITYNSSHSSKQNLPSRAIKTSSNNHPSSPDLQQARQLADAGHLTTAINCCKTYLESYSTNAEA
ncbi:MAG TPA: protein-glutamate O-methyltransferase CheR, partial [Allocoleopsis sp.]